MSAGMRIWVGACYGIGLASFVMLMVSYFSGDDHAALGWLILNLAAGRVVEDHISRRRQRRMYRAL